MIHGVLSNKKQRATCPLLNLLRRRTIKHSGEGHTHLLINHRTERKHVVPSRRGSAGKKQFPDLFSRFCFRHLSEHQREKSSFHVSGGRKCKRLLYVESSKIVYDGYRGACRIRRCSFKNVNVASDIAMRVVHDWRIIRVSMRPFRK